MGEVAEFYGGRDDLVGAIRAALVAAGADLDALRPADLSSVDEFHIRGRAASLEIAEALGVGKGDRVVDLGSGLGGPARTVAELTGCAVTGVDLTPEFTEAAATLSEWTGLSARTRFQVGDATATGLTDESADAAMTVHVAMNIADKPALYAEAFRLLRPGGRFVVYDVAKGDGGTIHFPVPWAADQSTSFLAAASEMVAMLRAAGFDVVSEVDSSAESLEWFREMKARIERDGPPPITFATFLGSTFGQMAANQVANLAEGRIRTVMLTSVRPT
jgi:ubiquinone/menaquinone biosynthesis C-methylase UbiE